jgi:RimJ/RimL family protein N-acetyltransferase
MIIRRSYDEEFLYNTMMHPSVHPYILDDSSMDDLDINPIINSKNWFFLVPEVDEEPIGFFMCNPVNFVTWEIHVAILPKFRGKIAKLGAIGAIRWMFTHTTCKKIIARISVTNKAAINFAKKAGLTEEGISQKSFSVGGKLYDEIMFGIMKEEF